MITSIPQRVCTKCQNAFPETSEFFRKDKTCRRGLSPWCKPCHRTHNLAYDKAHRPNRARPDRIRETFKQKRERTEKPCSTCRVVKPLEDFALNRQGCQGYGSRCKVCSRERDRARGYRGRPRLDPGAYNTPGYIYIVYSIGRYKIGFSITPQKRVRQIQSPYPVDLICIIQTDDMLSLENKLHARFDHARKHGEWFELSDEDIDEIKHMA